MHAIVAVIHREQHLDEEWFSRFCWDNSNYYEKVYRTNSLEESLEQVEEYISYLKKNFELLILIYFFSKKICHLYWLFCT